MKLTGKCKEEFEGWYRKLVGNYDPTQGYYTDFTWFTESMKFGVYVDYADSLGVVIPSVSNGWGCFYITYRGNMQQFKTRPEARNAAIEMFNRIRNKQL